MSIKKILLSITVFVSLTMPFGLLSSATYAADPLGGACDKLTQDEREQSTTCNSSVDGDDPLTGSDGLIIKIARGVALVAGSIAVIVIIIAGITMVTSSGDSQSFKTARDAVIYASVGLLVIAVAGGLVTLVLNGV